MNRINIPTDDGHVAGWFDLDRATEFQPQRRWDGSNMRDINARGNFEHQELYRTAQGRWVLRHWSQREGSPDTFRFVSDDVAREWLIRNEHDDAVERYFDQLTEEEGPRPTGRPEEGRPINVRLPETIITALDERAAQAGEPRAEVVRRLLSDALT